MDGSPRPHMRLRRSLPFVAIWMVVVIAMALTLRSGAGILERLAGAVSDTNLAIWDVLHDLADESLGNSTVDYTFWDDMAAFANDKLGDDWAQDNLVPGLDSFGIDALWVYRPDGTLRFSIMLTDTGTTGVPPQVPFSMNEFAIQLGTHPDEVLREFYWISPIGPLTLVGSDITTTDDPDHQKPGQGFYFTARMLTPERGLASLSKIDASGEVIALTEVPRNILPAHGIPSVIWHRMFDITGATIGAIRIERASPTYEAIWTAVRNDTLQTGTLLTILGIVVSWLLVASDRLRERSRALEEDVAQRTKSELELRTRSHELEVMNKAMIDRELKMVELKKKLEEGGPQGIS